MEDPRQFYLAYHEGPAGFKRATYRGKPRIEQAAANVAARARRYASQLGSCRADLDAQLEGSGWWPF